MANLCVDNVRSCRFTVLSIKESIFILKNRLIKLQILKQRNEYVAKILSKEGKESSLNKNHWFKDDFVKDNKKWMILIESLDDKGVLESVNKFTNELKFTKKDRNALLKSVADRIYKKYLVDKKKTYECYQFKQEFDSAYLEFKENGEGQISSVDKKVDI